MPRSILKTQIWRTGQGRGREKRGGEGKGGGRERTEKKKEKPHCTIALPTRSLLTSGWAPFEVFNPGTRGAAQDAASTLHMRKPGSQRPNEVRKATRPLRGSTSGPCDTHTAMTLGPTPLRRPPEPASRGAPPRDPAPRRRGAPAAIPERLSYPRQRPHGTPCACAAPPPTRLWALSHAPLQTTRRTRVPSLATTFPPFAHPGDPMR